LPVVAQHLNLALDLLAVCDDGAGLPERAQILARIKTETACDSHRAGLSSFVFGAVRLACVLDHRYPVTSRNLKDGVHVRGLTEYINRDHCLCSLTDLTFPQFRSL